MSITTAHQYSPTNPGWLVGCGIGHNQCPARSGNFPKDVTSFSKLWNSERSPECLSEIKPTQGPKRLGLINFYPRNWFKAAFRCALLGYEAMDVSWIPLYFYFLIWFWDPESVFNVPVSKNSYVWLQQKIDRSDFQMWNQNRAKKCHV